MRMSVIMPVYLGKYEFLIHRSASDPENKFRRAINSFLQQTFDDAELIIVSDGCDASKAIYLSEFSDEHQIRFTQIPKQPLYGGMTRQTGVDMAIGDIICYLDHDDMFGNNHLRIINDNFDTDMYAWVYYDDYLVRNADHSKIDTRTVVPMRNWMGTSSIAHRRDIGVVWGDGNTHDFDMIEKYLLHLKYTKIPTPQYYVCHCSGLKMDF